MSAKIIQFPGVVSQSQFGPIAAGLVQPKGKPGHDFLTGFHEERGEIDPPDPDEPPMLRNVVDMDDDRVDPVPARPMRLKDPS